MGMSSIVSLLDSTKRTTNVNSAIPVMAGIPKNNTHTYSTTQKDTPHTHTSTGGVKRYVCMIITKLLRENCVSTRLYYTIVACSPRKKAEGLGLGVQRYGVSHYKEPTNLVMSCRAHQNQHLNQIFSALALFLFLSPSSIKQDTASRVPSRWTFRKLTECATLIYRTHHTPHITPLHRGAYTTVVVVYSLLWDK